MNISYQYLIPVLFLLSIILVVAACAGTKKQATTEDESPQEMKEPFRFYFNTQPCFGFCPVVKMYFDSEGAAYFDGIRNYDRVGPHELPEAKMRIPDIFETIAVTQWDTSKNDYPNVVTDLPTWVFVFATDSSYHKIRGYNNLPDTLRVFGEKLLELGKGPHWKRYDVMIPEFSPGDYTDNELIIHLKDDVETETFLKPYKRYEFELVRRLSPGMRNYWLCTFNENRVTRDNLIEILKKDESVLEVQAKRKARLRDGN